MLNKDSVRTTAVLKTAMVMREIMKDYTFKSPMQISTYISMEINEYLFPEEVKLICEFLFEQKLIDRLPDDTNLFLQKRKK